MSAKYLIVGFCTYMPVDKVAVLCRSVRAVYPPRLAEIVLITNDPDLYAEGLAGLDVSFHLTTCDYAPTTSKTEKAFKRAAFYFTRMLAGGFLDRKFWGGACSRFLPNLIESWCHPQIARWRAYAPVLRARPYVEKVLLTDTKDVILQDDCFADLEGECVQLFDEGMTVPEERWTASWIRDGFGEAAVRSMEGIPVICVGTVLGTRKATLGLLDGVESMFLRYPFRTVDQGTMNWLWCKEGDSEHVARVPNITGAVATVSSDAAKNALAIDEGLIVRRSDGTVVPIVHMWDRWSDLQTAVVGRLGSTTPVQGQPS